MIKGIEFHSIIDSIFGEVRNLEESEQIKVNCPKCQERDGLSEPDGKFNLEINTGKKVFRCWKCEEPKFSGRLSKLIKIYGSNIDYKLFKSLGGLNYSFSDDNNDDDFDIEEINIKLPNEIISFENLDIEIPSHFEAYNYLINDRLVSRDIIFKYHLGFCTSGYYKDRIIIPSYDKYGEVNYFTARSFVDDPIPYLNPDINKNYFIFNEGFVNWNSTIFLVEGVFEMLTLPINIIPLLGKELFKSLYDEISNYKPNVVILLDPDAKSSAMKLFYQLSCIYGENVNDYVKIIDLPENLDLNEYKKKYGQNKLIDMIYSARRINNNDYFINVLSENI